MKKWMKTGKKALSVFMAVMMVMTAWVWVAPTEASAAEMGKYEVTIKFNLEDDDAVGGHVLIWYYPLKADNSGFDTTQTSKKHEVVGSLAKVSGDKEYTQTVSGFPWRLEIKIDDTDLFDETYLDLKYFKIGDEVIVGSSIGNFQNAICYFDYNGTFTPHDENGGSIGANAGRVDSITGEGFTWDLPKPDTNSIIEYSNVKDMTCPKSNTTATQTVKVKVNDQYGVPMYNPKWSVSGSVCGNTGISVTSTTTASESTVITLTNSANVAGTTHSQVGTIVADWGTGTLSDTFTINDTTYTATFKYKNASGVDTSATRNGQHGATITAPSAPEYDSGDYHYVFSKWSPTFASTITKDVTYTAQYTSTFVEADYSGVNNAIAAANAIKAQYDTEYELKYTLASRVALDSAINAVVTGLGRTRQSDVDGYADTINAKIAALDPNKFDVIFFDKDGAILLYEKDVEYKESVTAPSYSDKYYDSTNHYTFTGWDTDEYASVVDDLVIQPVFTAEAHTFTTETVPSTCVQKGATKYICSCGYSYIDGETDYGDHVWETEFTTDLEPTCTVAGSKSIHCTLCDAQKDITAIAPLDHQWGTVSSLAPATCDRDGINTRLCDACGFCEHTIIPALEHDFKETVVAPTCTAKGYTEYVCQRADCGYSYRDTYTDVTAHDYGAWETVSEAYCGVQGVKKRVCEDCGFTELGSIDALTHDSLDSLEWNVVVEDTCDYAGYRTKTCSKCNNVIAAENFDIIKGHDIKTETTPATCTTAGQIVETCQRENCGYTKTTVIQPLTHNWDSGKTTAATCTSGGYITYTCQRDNCGETRVEIINGSSALLHDFTGTETIVTAATCEADGEKTVKCTRCDATTTVIIPKLGHSYGDWVKTDATNDKDGSWYHKCSACNKEETLVIPKGGHNLVEDTAQYVAPKCNTKGQRVYKCTAHENCSVTVTVELDYAQHTIANDNEESTCTSTGHSKTYCSVCNLVFNSVEIPAKAHNYTAQDAVAPTCTTSGYTPYKCLCGDTYNVYDEAKPATGHDFDETVATNVTTIPATCTADGSKTVKCSKCDAIKEEVLPKTGHNFVENASKATSATCTALATKTFECSCGASYVEHVGPLAAHKFDTLVKTVPATNDSLGYEERKCACGLVEITILEATGTHVFNEKITGECIAPTCTENGTNVYKCTAHTDCGAKSSVLVPRLGHTVTAVYKAPSCVAEGSSDAYCTTCNTTINSTVIPVKGHAYNTVTVKTEAGCETTGVRTYTCECGASYTEEIPAKGHDLSTTVTDATCGTVGKVIIDCANCNDPAVEKTIELAAKGHIWKDAPESKVDANCETDGIETYKCQNCEETNVVVIPKLGHEWDNWSVTKASTNTEKGEMTRTCSRGCTETVEIPAGGHELVVDNDKSTPASCSKEGTTVYKCKNHDNCGITLSVTTDKLQHELEKTETPATCTTDGSVVTKCKKCETATYTIVIPATGHDYLAVITKAASCTEEGIRTYTCACGDTKTEVIPMVQHNYVAGTPVPATCTSSGYTPYKCENCESGYVILTDDATGHEIVEGSSTATCTEGGKMTLTCKNCTAYSETVDVPALGHNYEKKSSTTATCKAAATETYKCSRCTSAYTVSVGDKTTEHKWGALTTVDATNTSLGYTTRTCEECGQVEFNIIPATGEHKFDVETEDKKAQTCTEDGYIVYACSTHTDCGLTSKATIPANGHKEKLDYKAATCETAGYSKVICETCKSTIGEEVTISALGHLFDGEGVYEAATCETAGSMTYTCSRQDCNATHITTIAVNPDAHKTETNTIDATCKSEGSVITSCTLCDKELIKTPLPMLQHEWGEWTVIPAANGTPGSATRTCANGCTETVEIPAGGHRFGDTPVSTTPATCSATGTETYKCIAHTDCGIEITVTTAKAAHTPKYEIVDATCTNEGSIKTVCEKCDATLVEAITIGKLQHVFEQQGESVDATCTSSGYTVFKCKNCTETYKQIGENAIGHELVITSDSSSCTVEGKVTVTCNKCDLEQTSKVPALGHDYVEDTSAATEATCAQAATKTYKCSRCSASYTVSVGDKLTEESAHKWSGWTTVKDATDISIGYKTKECEVCGKLEVVTIEANGEHKFADGEVVEGGASKAATCTENGYETRRCSVHENCTETAIVTIPATGHSEETIEATDATCTAPGSTVGTKCSKCDTVLDAPVEIPALGHAWGNEKVTPATCQTAGKIEYTCTRANCNESHTVEIAVDEDAHSLVTDVEQATCEAPGKVTVSCSNACGYNKETEIPAKGHTWDDGTVTKNASCESTGIKTHTCVNCGESSDEIIPALGHIYEAGEKVSATCTTSGYTVYTCKNDANHTYNVYDSDATATGHDWTEWTIVEKATETTDGYKERTCKVDGCDGKEKEVIPAMKHNMVLADEKASTCKDAGYKVYKCETEHDGVICNYTLRVDLPLVAHTLVTTVTESTCQAEGSVVTACECGYKLEEKTLAVKPHTIAYSTHYPNCEDGGYVKAYCTNTGCTYNKIIETSDALGHDFTIDVSIDKSATCLEEGSKTVKCSRCEETTTVTIPAKGHDYKPGEEVKATCTESGYIPYTCACGDSYNKLTSEPTSHNWVVDNKSCVEPTCETEGKTVYRCSCGAEKETVISKHGHSWVWTLTKNPTAKDDGILTGECVRCHATQTFTIPAIGGGSVTCVVTFVVDGKVVATQNVNYGGSATAPEISKASDANNHYSLVWDNDFTNVTSDLTVTAQFVASAHSFGGWETEIEATCSKAGSMKRVCSECGYAETKITETTDHDYSIIIKTVDATCTENGYIEKECKDCHKKTTEVLRRLGHNLTYHEGYAATCTEDGERAHYSCSRCGNLFEDAQGRIVITDVVIGKRYHSLVIIEGKDATCTVDGSTDYVRCTVCGYTENSTTIPAYGHTDVNNDKCCDRCDSAYLEGGEIVCTCSCHKPGIINEIIYKIIRFFWKLFGSNKSCECGVLHY